MDPDPERQRCEGILGATGTAGAETGDKVTGMINQLTSLLLAKSVVGETHEIDTENIKVNLFKIIRQIITLKNIIDFCKKSLWRKRQERVFYS